MFENATILDGDFISNELGYTLPWEPKMQKAKFRNYYVETCALLDLKHVGGITPAEIEASLNTPERKYNFKYAMAKQLIYDCQGKNSMMRETDEKYDLCRESVRIYKALGLWREARVI